MTFQSILKTPLPWARYCRLERRNSSFSLQQSAPCPLCHGDGFRVIQEIDDLQGFQDQAGENRFTQRVVSCDDCGTLYTNPWFTPEGFRFLMEKAGASYGTCDPEERVTWIQEFCPEAASLLDLGCGDGRFLSALPSQIKRVGMEADPSLAALVQKRDPSLNLVQANIEDAEQFPETDVVTLFHLLEHVKEPRVLLRRLRQNAGASRKLVVEVPILDRAVECQGPDLCGFFSIPHRTHFSRRTLCRLLAETGWSIIQETHLQGNGFRVLSIPSQWSPNTTQESMASLEHDQQLLKDYLEVHEKSLEQVQTVIDGIPREAHLLIWGAGHHTELLDRQTRLFTPDRSYLLVDRDPLKHGMRVHGIPVVSPDSLPEEVWKEENLRVVVSSFAWQSPIVQDLKKQGAGPQQILTLYP